jgi:molybdopterin-guanine dinucleotide biosynthesis protein A
VKYTPIMMASKVRDGGPIHGLVLVGGQSRRMGRPKQTVVYRGSTLAGTVARALQPHVEQVVLAGSGPIPKGLESLPKLSDPPDVAGPIAGVLAAMRWSPETAWIVAACDMPRISFEAVRWLIEQRRPGTWAVLPRSPSGKVEAVLAVYELQARPLVEALVTAGRWGLRHLAEHEQVVCPAIPAELAEAWTNINTPEELRNEE